MRRAQNIFILKNINCLTVVITLEGIEKIKPEKKRQENSLKNISFTNTVKKMGTFNTVIASRF